MSHLCDVLNSFFLVLLKHISDLFIYTGTSLYILIFFFFSFKSLLPLGIPFLNIIFYFYAQYKIDNNCFVSIINFFCFCNKTLKKISLFIRKCTDIKFKRRYQSRVVLRFIKINI